MEKVLFVKANSRPIDQAVSVQMYHAFLQSYQNAHPEDQIFELDLFTENLPYYDAEKINAMFKHSKGLELTLAEQESVNLVNKYLNQFLESDKVIIAFPLWNFTVPAVLHTYLDYLNQAGKTFRYTREGAVGLLKDKKVVLLNARGGVYSTESMQPLEMAVNYVTNILKFWGIEKIDTVIVEGHNQFPERSEAIIQEGIRKTKEAALVF